MPTRPSADTTTMAPMLLHGQLVEQAGDRGLGGDRRHRGALVPQHVRDSHRRLHRDRVHTRLGRTWSGGKHLRRNRRMRCRLDERERTADTRNESMTNKTADVPTVTLGDELTVSAIGFGAMALTPVYGEVDDTESLATLHRCLDLGVTFIDTANVYGGGNNEQLISRLLADRRDEVTLATKFGIASNPADRAAGRPGGPRGRRLRAQVHRREPVAVEDRCRRPLLHASPRPVGAHRGDRRARWPSW